jgi:hypothetical protein
MWRGYNEGKNNNFARLKINHNINFVNPINKDIHKNTIERAWGSKK